MMMMVLTRLGEIQGLSGLLAARYCDRVWLTDKDPQVLDTLQRSVQLNAG
jgi:predicted RNA methylase